MNDSPDIVPTEAKVASATLVGRPSSDRLKAHSETIAITAAAAAIHRRRSPFERSRNATAPVSAAIARPSRAQLTRGPVSRRWRGRPTGRSR